MREADKKDKEESWISKNKINKIERKMEKEGRTQQKHREKHKKKTISEKDGFQKSFNLNSSLKSISVVCFYSCLCLWLPMVLECLQYYFVFVTELTSALIEISLLGAIRLLELLVNPNLT